MIKSFTLTSFFFLRFNKFYDLKIKSWMASNKLGHRFEKKLVKSKNARLMILRFEKLLSAKITAETWARVSLSPLSQSGLSCLVFCGGFSAECLGSQLCCAATCKSLISISDLDVSTTKYKPKKWLIISTFMKNMSWFGKQKVSQIFY